jgi:aarF domain-containing kinase
MLRSTVIKYSTRATGVAVTSGLAYGAYLYETDEGYHRMMQAYSTFVPVVLHYRWMEFRHKHSQNYSLFKEVTEEEWEQMDERYAIPTVTKLAALQGMYCKYGQTAAGFTNTFGDAWIREFRKLENEVPPRPVESVYATIQQETGNRPVEETFCYFDPQPLGSASIGQVHRAKLHDGRDVAVKVQYPEAQELFQEDIHTIRAFCEALAPENVVVLDALEKQNAAELDYMKEAENLREIRANMVKHGFQPREVLVPTPIPEYSTHRLLVMELLPGPKLIDGMRVYFSEWAEKHGTTLHDLETNARAKIESEGIPAKYEGPSARQVGWYRTWLRTKDTVANAGIATYNGTAGWVGQPLKYQQTTLPPNTPRIIDTLMRVHGYQLFRDGVFNSDPHGGNFLLLPDGRIGLIDYGATKRFTRNERLAACMLFAALYRKDEQRLFDMCDISGYKSKYGKKDVLMKLLQFGYDSWGHDVTGGKNIQQFLDELKHEDPWEEVPDNFVLAQVIHYKIKAWWWKLSCCVRGKLFSSHNVLLFSFYIVYEHPIAILGLGNESSH